MDAVVTSMMTAVLLIVIILASGGCRLWLRRKFDPAEHIDSVTKAVRRQQIAKDRLAHVHSQSTTTSIEG